MNKILRQLYNGELYPAAGYVEGNDLYWKKRSAHATMEDDFRVRLNEIDPAMRKQFDKILEEIAEEYPLECETVFSQGFRLGAKLMMTILTEE